MQIHWAVFGERNGGHALLAASGNSTFAARITQYTDRPGDPPMGLDWGPVDSGFFFSEHYVFLRTLPDPTAGRAGMVRSYAAYAPASELVSLEDLAGIFSQMPRTLEKPPVSLNPLMISESVPTASVQADIPGLMAIAQQLGSPNPALPLVWASEQPYLPTVDAVWKRLPASLRPAFAFGFQFAPEHKLPVKPTLIATLPALAGRWSSEQIIHIETEQTGKLNTAQSWFAGLIGAPAFNDVLADYGIVVKEFGELNLLSVFADLIARLSELSFGEASKAVRIVEKYSKTNKVSAKSRPALFARLCALISTATPEEVARLRNLDAKALDDLIGPLQTAMQGWIPAATLSKQQIANFEMAADAPTKWWSKPFIAYLEKVASLHSVVEAETVCSLFVSSKICKLITRSLARDTNTEGRVIAGLPRKLGVDHAENILRLVQERSWMRLHAVCLMRSRSHAEAIKAHAKIAGRTTVGFELMYEQLGFAPMLDVACASGDTNLIDYIGAILHDNIVAIPRYIAGKCAHWHSILAQAVCQSKGELAKPLRSLVISALEHPSEASTSFAELAAACTTRDLTIWLELAAPTLALSLLNPDVKDETTAKISAHVAAEIRALRPVELKRAEGFHNILNVEVLLQALFSVAPTDAVKAGVNVFRSIPFLSDDDCRRWLIDLFTRTHYVKLNADDAREIASVLLAADYPKSAQVVRETAEKYFRSDVVPIFHEIRYKYQLAKQHQSASFAKTARLPKVIIATALPLERDEVIKLLGVTEYDAGLRADVASWPSDNPIFEVWVFTTGAGNLEAQGAILPALRQLKPKFAFFVGVAGGMKDSDVGDVIYSTKVYYYEGGKEEDDGIKSRPMSERTSEDLVQLALRVATQPWQPAEAHATTKPPKATPAIIASGENVLASIGPQATTFHQIKKSYNDTQVVDMEGYGFLKACRDEDVRHSMVIRGVSDKIVGKAKSDAKGNQPLAARNAAAFLFILLRSCSDILKPKQKKRKKILGIF
jgi:nucleoside phosphorylase